MPTYRVNLVNVGSWSVDLEAEDEQEAIDMALDQAPTENVYTGFDLGEWMFASELFPGSATNEPSVELID